MAQETNASFSEETAKKFFIKNLALLMTFASHLFWLNCIRKLSDFDLVYLVKVEFSRVENCLVHL